MFNPGSNWAEASSDQVTITVVDPGVTLESLDVALGSLYQDEITVEAADVVPILAAANLLQLEGLIDQCLVIMLETVNFKTVVGYYQTSLRYNRLKEFRHYFLGQFLKGLLGYGSLYLVS